MRFEIVTCGDKTPKHYFPKCIVLKDIVNMYFIDVNSLEELMEIKKKYGYGIILETEYNDVLKKDVEVLKIYDGWNE